MVGVGGARSDVFEGSAIDVVILYCVTKATDRVVSKNYLGTSATWIMLVGIARHTTRGTSPCTNACCHYPSVATAVLLMWQSVVACCIAILRYDRCTYNSGCTETRYDQVRSECADCLFLLACLSKEHSCSYQPSKCPPPWTTPRSSPLQQSSTVVCTYLLSAC